ncbi:MAG: NAD(P)H-hydrate dehydratase [Candidatus Omnitrophica bacterium]|nr:NAD(P)H-hydrate dehydratase [Candidatus Omnitrophota bacterium]
MRLPVQLLKRKPDTHKGDYGHVLIIGGSIGLSGAVCLSAKAALRSGAGLVTVGVPNSLNSIFETKLTEAMSLPLADKGGALSQEAFSDIKSFLKKVDLIVLGPGAGLRVATKRLIVRIVKEIDKPMIIDADALTALASNLEVLLKRKTKTLILTPHLGEFSRLVKLDLGKIKKVRKELVKKFALRYNLTLVLKGNRTLVSDGRRTFENSTGNPGMATAGTGDVLSGIISGLLSQGVDQFQAAKLGVYLHGLAGDYAAGSKTQNCLIASDVIEYLPSAVKSLLKKS